MTRTITTCDRCGAEIDNSSCYWSNKIIQIKIYCPPDGINGGLYEQDLCYQCRTELNNYLSQFFKKD